MIHLLGKHMCNVLQRLEGSFTKEAFFQVAQSFFYPDIFMVNSFFFLKFAA